MKGEGGIGEQDRSKMEMVLVLFCIFIFLVGQDSPLPGRSQERGIT